MGAGASKSDSSSSSQQQATQATDSFGQQFGSDVWGAQSPYLQNMYQMAAQQAGQPMGGGQGMGMSNQFLGQGGQALGQAQQGYGQAQQGYQQSNQALGQANQALGQYMNPGTDPALDAYSQRMGQQYREQFMPQMNAGAMQAGGLGGSRNQIGAALGADRAMQGISDFAANSYAGQQQRGLAAAQSMGQNAMGYGQNAAGMGQNAAGMGSLGGMYGALGGQALGNADFARSMPWYNVNQFAGLLGGPTMTDQGGYTSSTSRGQSTGESKSKSSSTSVSISGA